MPFLTSTTAIVLSIFIAAWVHVKHFEATQKRIDDLRSDVLPILRDIQARLTSLEQRVARLEERTNPIVRG
jgi:hypothetical protein